MTKIEPFPLLTPEYLLKRWVTDEASREEIAAEVGCSVGLIMKRVRLWKTFRRGVISRDSWNKGLTKETDERLAIQAEAVTGEGNPMFGVTAWNKGVSADSDPRVAKMVEAMRKGFDTSDTREKMAEAKRGKTGEETNRWKGGWTPSGLYLAGRVSVSGRRMYKHRAVAESCLERVLKTSEHVHHIDRSEGNNAPENLMVISKCDHATLHGAIYRGEGDTRQEQIEWLVANQINFEVLCEDQINYAA